MPRRRTERGGAGEIGDIGERLYLSHRTVGTHLYRIFPKLGITARTELAAALSRADAG